MAFQKHAAHTAQHTQKGSLAWPRFPQRLPARPAPPAELRPRRTKPWGKSCQLNSLSWHVCPSQVVSRPQYLLASAVPTCMYYKVKRKAHLLSGLMKPHYQPWSSCAGGDTGTSSSLPSSLAGCCRLGTPSRLQPPRSATAVNRSCLQRLFHAEVPQHLWLWFPAAPPCCVLPKEAGGPLV